MSALAQLPIPYELRVIVREFLYYSKKEHIQRKHKKKLIRYLNACERLYWDDPSTVHDYFYYKIVDWQIRTIENYLYVLNQDVIILSSILCKQCHEYVESNTQIPANLMCWCFTYPIPEVD